MPAVPLIPFHRTHQGTYALFAPLFHPHNPLHLNTSSPPPSLMPHHSPASFANRARRRRGRRCRRMAAGELPPVRVRGGRGQRPAWPAAAAPSTRRPRARPAGPAARPTMRQCHPQQQWAAHHCEPAVAAPPDEPGGRTSPLSAWRCHGGSPEGKIFRDASACPDNTMVFALHPPMTGKWRAKAATTTSCRERVFVRQGELQTLGMKRHTDSSRVAVACTFRIRVGWTGVW